MAQRYVDPNSKIIWEFDGYSWVDVGIATPPGTEPPFPTPIPVQIRTDANSPDDGAAKFNSAMSVARSSRSYNTHLFARYKDAYRAWATGGKRTKEPESPVQYYRIEDFDTLYYLYMLPGIEVPIPPDVAYNQK